MRPWGPLDWLLTKLGRTPGAICVLGALASEDRCRAVPLLALQQTVRRLRLLDIQDPPSDYTAGIKEKKEASLAALEAAGLEPASVIPCPLLASAQLIADRLEAFLGPVEKSAPVELWIDISCLPKRFFFLLTKLALKRASVETLVVTYTEPGPGRYTEEHLAEDPEDVRPLPGFGPQAEDPNAVVVALGFETLGLQQLLAEYRDRKGKIVFLLPFPPGQPYSRRVWQSVLAVGGPTEGPDVRRLTAIDAFNAYAELCRLFDPALPEIRAAPPALAPYGPKPISLGMCLYAISTGSPVFYTQPRRYHPDYTIGIGGSWGYCLRLNGVDMWR
jgi:hypothetical protein